MQHDFTLLAGGGQTIDVAGKFFKYKSGVGAIRVRDNRGGVIDLLPGQGVWNTEYSQLLVQDISGAANRGVILAGDFDFHDDRINGTVDVVDGGKARTLANNAFLLVGSQGVVTAELAHVQLWNPAASSKNLIVEQVILSTSVDTQINGYITNALINAIGTSGQSKKGGGAVSVGVASAKSQGAAISGAGVYAGFVKAGAAAYVNLREPIILPPGYGLHYGNQNTASLLVTFEYVEEAV